MLHVVVDAVHIWGTPGARKAVFSLFLTDYSSTKVYSSRILRTGNLDTKMVGVISYAG